MPLPSSPLVLTVAFAGHRAADPGPGAAPMNDAIHQAFALVAEATRSMAATPVAHGTIETVLASHSGLDGRAATMPAFRLLSGYAPGTDRIAVQAWREGAYGPTHLVFPFLAPGMPSSEERPEAAFTDDPDHPEAGAYVVLADMVLGPEDVVSVLDGTTAKKEQPPRAAHLEQSRFLVRWADVLVALWNGEPAQGAGGTADAVRLAIAKGLPVIWIDPRNWAIRLINPLELWADTSPAELFALLQNTDHLDTYMPPASAEALSALLIPLFTPPSEKPNDDDAHKNTHEAPSETDARKDYEANIMAPKTLRGRIWMGIGLAVAAIWRPFVKCLSCVWSAPHSEPAHSSAATESQEGLKLLKRESARASQLADYTGDLQRVVQVLLLLLAVIAVMVATAAAIWPERKPLLVFGELFILGVVFFVWKVRGIAINHRRWSDSRRLAERLRGMLATWPLAVDVADDRAEAPGSWTEWRAKALLRLAGPPTGTLDQARMMEDARFGRDDPHGIVLGQANYHQITEARQSKCAHRLEMVEGGAFFALLALIILFLGYYYFAELWHLDHHDVEHAGHWLLFASAVLPMVAAACLAIEAKVGFHENAIRSQRLKPRFEKIKMDMADEKLSPALAQESLKEAAQLLTSDADGWRDGVWRRRLAKL